MEATVETNPRKLALTNGLVWAAINLTIFLVLFYAMPNMMGSIVMGIIQLLLGIGIACYFCIDLRKKIGGYWTFRQALSGIFLMFFAQALIVYFFTILFAKIEPTYLPKMKEISTTATISMLQKMGMDQDKIDQAVADMDKKMDEKLNPGFFSILIGICLNALGYFIGALIFAAIFKKDPPIFAPTEEE